MSLIKLAKKIMLDVQHIKQDGKEFKEIKELANKINKIVGDMQSEDKGVLKHASLIKIAVPGAGFAALERIGLAGKAMATHAGSSWLSNPVAKAAVKPGLSAISGLPIKPVLTREAFLSGAKGSRVAGNKFGAFTTPFSVGK